MRTSSRSELDIARVASRSPRITAVYLTLISLSALLLFAAPALAATTTDRPLLFSFDGSDTTAGKFSSELLTLGIDDSTGSVYVLDRGKAVLDKFDAAGVAQSFSATGTSSLNGAATPQGTFTDLSSVGDISVDNSGGPNQGRLYFSSAFSHGDTQGGPVSAFSSAGSYLWQLPGSLSGLNCGTAVDTAGHLWVTDEHIGKIVEFDNTGSPPAEIGAIENISEPRPCRANLDASGNLYVSRGGRVDKYVSGVFSSTLDTEVTSSDIAIDQSSATGHIFTIHQEDFNEYDSSGTLVGSFAGGQIENGEGIAYDKALDRVYVTDQASGTVKVFGPPITGTVPDPTIEATTEIGVGGLGKARFNGKVNPQGVPNSYFFEWTQGTGSDWSGSSSSSPQALPQDSSDHAVSFNVSGLQSNRTYQVRLVTENTENGLRSLSSADTFTSAKAAAAPALTIATPSPVGTTTAEVSGTVNPIEDPSTTWRLQLSTDPACASGFEDKPQHNLGSEANSPIAVSEELTGLISNQHYCVLMTATNSFGTSTSETKEFTTEASPPTQVFTAFAAPRTDTTARINGRANPEDLDLTYHFEYSKDGGATWIAGPEREDTSKAREQLIFGEELTGLTPNTTYQYRFSAENSIGPASPQGEVKSFTTRTTAEMSLPARGYELVNNPDKGNQNVWDGRTAPAPRVSPDGEKAVWSVLGGAPEGNSGTGATYLAERTPEGWRSRSLVPPGEEQPGQGGSGGYLLTGVSRDYSKFFFQVGVNAVGGGKTVVGIDADGNQTVLREYFHTISGLLTPNISDDGAHVLVVAEDEPRQVEDIGSGAPEVVSIMPDGSPSGCVDNRAYSFPGQDRQERAGYRSMSADASRVYFRCGAFGRSLFERNRETEETFEIDPSGNIEIIRATPNGRHVYFVTNSALDPADTNSGRDVYRWDEEEEASTCLTCVVPDANLYAGAGSSFAGAILVSDDFSHIYFESTNVLVPGEGQAGDTNLYVLSGGQIRYVADPDVRGEENLNRELPNALSSDGNVLVFREGVEADQAPGQRELTADKVATQCQDPFFAGGAGPCSELVRYDDRDGSLECISCRHDRETVNTIGAGARIWPVSPTVQISADGETIVFASREALIPKDINNDADLYEWSHGVLRLITDGLSSFQEEGAAPQVFGLSKDGRDVFFGVADPGLTGFEQDGLMNLYDARIGGGFEPPGPAVHCSEEACQGPLVPVPGGGAASSASFNGHGNLAPQPKKRRPCAKQRGKAKQRCIRKHKRHSHKARAQENTRRAK